MLIGVKEEMKKSRMPDILADKFYNYFVMAEDQKFFDIVFSKNPSQKVLDELLEVWDIEATGGRQALLLSYLMKECPELKFNACTTAKLKRLVDCHRYKNIRHLSWFKNVGQALNKEGILPMLFKGSVMKALRPELSRLMGDVDFFVRPDEFDRTIAIAEKQGFNGKRARHSIDMQTANGDYALDIHVFFKTNDWKKKGIPRYARELSEGFFKRARKMKCFGTECLIPSNEDLFFIALANLSKNITSRTSTDKTLFALFDMKFLTAKENFDWDIVLEDIKTSNCSEKTVLSAKFVERIAPGFLPEILRENIPLNDDVKSYYELMFYDQCHYLDSREKCRGLVWADVMKNFRLLPKYTVRRIKYKFMGFVRKSPALLRLHLRCAYSEEFPAALIDEICEAFVTPADKKCFDFLFSENPIQRALDEFLEVWDIEGGGIKDPSHSKAQHEAVLLYHLAKQYPKLDLSNVNPKFNGVIECNKCRLLDALFHFSKVGKALNKEGIVPVVLEYVSMKILGLEVIRAYRALDLLICHDEFSRAVKIVKKIPSVFTPCKLHEFLGTTKLTAQWFYKRAKKINYNGVECLMPSKEDLFFITLLHLSQHITTYEYARTTLRCMLYIRFLTAQKDFDWDAAFEIIKTSGYAPYVKIAAEFVERIKPGFLPEALRGNISIEDEVRNYYERTFYEQYYCLNFYKKSRELHWVSIMKNPQFFPKHVAMRIKYKLMRFMRKRPALVRLYLRRNGNAHG